MVALAAGLLASAAMAFTLFLWLLLYGRDGGSRDFSAYADAQGWDHRPHPPIHVLRVLDALPEAKLHGDRPGPFFAGPSASGPFQAIGIERPMARSKGALPGWAGDRTLVHVRTATRSPGLGFRPRADFSLSAKDAPSAARDAIGHAVFDRRFDVTCTDPSFVSQALDYEACSLLLKPDRGVMASWQGHDLVFLFPLRPRTMAGYETLLRYAVAVTRRLERHEGRNLPVQPRSTPTVVPASVGAAQRHKNVAGSAA